MFKLTQQDLENARLWVSMKAVQSENMTRTAPAPRRKRDLATRRRKSAVEAADLECSSDDDDPPRPHLRKLKLQSVNM